MAAAVVPLTVAGGSFELDGGVADIELVVEVLTDALEKVVVETGIFFHQVGGESDLGGTEGPDVNVVDLGDFGKFVEILANGDGIDGVGYGVEGEIEGIGEELPGADEDKEGDEEADDGVEPDPAGEEDDGPGDHDTSGDTGVGGHVEEGPADVDVVFAAGHEEGGGGTVDENAEGGDPDDRATGDMGGFVETLDGLPDDGPDADKEEEGVEEGGEDGGTLPAVGAAGAGGALGEFGGDPGENEAEDVGEIVPGVGEEGEGLGEEAEDDLEDNEAGIEDNADEKGLPVVGRSV